MMTPEDSARLGLAIIVTAIVATGIAYYTIIRWLVW